jgi:hypothetical protein
MAERVNKAGEKVKSVTLYVPTSLLAKYEKKAKAEDRSVTYILLSTIKQAIQ